jgi:hypothetical protein
VNWKRKEIEMKDFAKFVAGVVLVVSNFVILMGLFSLLTTTPAPKSGLVGCWAGTPSAPELAVFCGKGFVGSSPK